MLPGRAEAMAELERRVMSGEVPLRSVTAMKGVEKVWQPSDLLTVEMRDEVRRQINKLSPELLIVLIGDTLTEEGLPTYTSRLFTTQGQPTETGDPHSENRPLAQWFRNWTAEEARHGTVLDRLLFMADRVNQKAYEGSKQLLLQDGMDIGIGTDPYRGFYYTSFQERATQVSHTNVAVHAELRGAPLVANICRKIALDETAHGRIYRDFAQVFLNHDPNGMMLAIRDMMERGVAMPAHNMREIRYENGDVLEKGETFEPFSAHAQRIGVYTTQDYSQISGDLLKAWKLAQRTTEGKWERIPIHGLGEEAEDAHQRIVRLQNAIQRKGDRWTAPAEPTHDFSWLVDQAKS
jgi:acyl-[acyl-carrier-protein] desaturase